MSALTCDTRLVVDVTTTISSDAEEVLCTANFKVSISTGIMVKFLLMLKNLANVLAVAVYVISS